MKYSAAFWGTSFVGEMSKLRLGEPSRMNAAAQEEAAKADGVEKTKIVGPEPVADTADLNGSVKVNGHINGNGVPELAVQESP